MTGYGKATAEFRGKKITAEVKSLNSKALDLTTRIAPLYREKELDIRAMIATPLERGKVDFCLWAEQEEISSATIINAATVDAYRRQIEDMCRQTGLPEPTDWWGTLLHLPDTLSQSETQTLDDEEWQVVRRTIEEAVERLMDFRRQEGKALEQKFTEKLDNIAALLSAIEPYERERTERIRNRIVEGLRAIPDVEYDRGRLEQEMIYYIEKLDINEEKQRLSNHLRYFRETMQTGHGQGKKLGFIAQEMGREINTTGSKSNQAEMQNIVVRMKDELEQIKEQVLNVM